MATPRARSAQWWQKALPTPKQGPGVPDHRAKVIFRPALQLLRPTEKTAGFLPLGHPPDQRAVGVQIGKVHPVQHTDHVDIAVLVGLPPAVAALQPQKEQAGAKGLFQPGKKALHPCVNVYHGSILPVTHSVDKIQVIPPIFFDLYPGLKENFRPHELLHVLPG